MLESCPRNRCFITARPPVTIGAEERDTVHAVIEKQEEHEKMTRTRSLSLGL